MTIFVSPSLVRSFLSDEDGQDVVEYALLASLIGISAIAIWKALALAVGTTYSAADTDIQALAPPDDPIS